MALLGGPLLNLEAVGKVVMKFIGVFLVVPFLGTLAWAADNATLLQAYRSAIKKTEPVAIQESLTTQAEESVTQARGYLFPTLTGVGTYTRQDQPPNPSVFTLADQYNAKLMVTQPIFHGFRDFAGLSGAQNLLKAQQHATDQSRYSLYDTVASSYYAVLSTEKDIANLQLLLDLTDKRVKELKERVQIGRSRLGELLSAQAQVATLKAQMEGALSANRQARATFELATGLTASTALTDSSEVLPAKPLPLENYLAKVEKRPDILAAKAQVEAAEDNVSYAWRGHLPSLDFTGNYYLKRTGALSGSNWDLGLVLSVPIFQGGIVQSQYKMAIDKRKQQELLLAQTRRNAIHQIQNAYVVYANSISQSIAFKEASEITEKNYNTQSHDYRNGLVTNLDVLDALNQFQTTKQQMDRTYYQAKSAEATLSAATGEVPATN